MQFELTSSFAPTGDQPEAIRQLAEGVLSGEKAQVLLGVTGSGKTFTMANVMARVQKPTLILSHNKTLAHQLYTEMKGFFPHNAVHYYVSYYDYYQPEAYIPSTDTYIEKDLAINEEIDRLRLAATSALLSGRRDVVVVSSVSCIYGMGAPIDFEQHIIRLRKGQDVDVNDIMRQLVDSLYVRNDVALERGHFRLRGEVLDVYLAYDEKILRILMDFDTVEHLQELDPETGEVLSDLESYDIYPANLFVTSKEKTERALLAIANDLEERLEYYRQLGDYDKLVLLKTRVNNDIEMIRELGHCTGIENYSRYFDGRQAGERPYCLLDFFPKDFLLFIDESHQTIPQIRAMYAGDRKRKTVLVEYGFRLPAALDNRPLHFDEFEAMTPQTIYVSATPADYELERAGGVVVEQLIRPTGLLEPQIIVRPSLGQIDDLLEEIRVRTDKGQRTLVTTLTKRMAEELTQYLLDAGVKASYIHSDVDTLERVEILGNLRAGEIDVLVGVNLLREGLDLPEVSLVAILDADKEGFLRGARALTQTIGRAARNIDATAILYADTITHSMQQTIEETERRRIIQTNYNTEHHITPHQVVRPMARPASGAEAYPITAAEETGLPVRGGAGGAVGEHGAVAHYRSKEQIQDAIARARGLMEQAAKCLDFTLAAQYRDEMLRLIKIRDKG